MERRTKVLLIGFFLCAAIALVAALYRLWWVPQMNEFVRWVKEPAVISILSLVAMATAGLFTWVWRQPAPKRSRVAFVFSRQFTSEDISGIKHEDGHSEWFWTGIRLSGNGWLQNDGETVARVTSLEVALVRKRRILGYATVVRGGYAVASELVSTTVDGYEVPAGGKSVTMIFEGSVEVSPKQQRSLDRRHYFAVTVRALGQRPTLTVIQPDWEQVRASAARRLSQKKPLDLSPGVSSQVNP